MRPTLLFLLSGLAALTAAPATSAQTVDYLVVAPALARLELPVAPGGSTTLGVTLRSTGSSSGDAELFGYQHSAPGALAGYQFVATDPRCRAPVEETIDTALRIVFRIGPFAPGETIACQYRVTRAPASPHDLSFRLCGPRLPAYNHHCGRLLRLGTLPDLSLRTEYAGVQEDGSWLLRVRAFNPGPVAVESRVVTTSCAEYQGGFLFPNAFDVEVGFPGACPAAEPEQTEGCLNFTGVNTHAYGYVVGPIPSGGESSCLLRLRPQAGSAYALQLYYLRDPMRLAGGGTAYDPNAANDAAPLGFLSPAPTEPRLVPIPAAGLGGLAGALVMLGAWRLRRRARS
jgi:hypothetical protein